MDTKPIRIPSVSNKYLSLINNASVHLDTVTQEWKYGRLNTENHN